MTKCPTWGRLGHLYLETGMAARSTTGRWAEVSPGVFVEIVLLDPDAIVQIQVAENEITQGKED